MEQYGYQDADFDDGDDSDLEAIDSDTDSEKDIGDIMHYISRQTDTSQSSRRKSSSSEDEFEKEIQQELTDTVKQNCEKMKIPPALSDEDLLYDPNMDELDQKWIDTQRMKYQPSVPPGAPVANTTKGTSTGEKKKQAHGKLPSSDAVLNCPACMTLLCLDCQRHEKFKSQYRAMFVTNCCVDQTEVLHYAESKKRRKKARSTADDDPYTTSCPSSSTTGNNDNFNPVNCRTCRTQVGVFDKDEIYHFFNVLSSYT